MVYCQKMYYIAKHVSLVQFLTLWLFLARGPARPCTIYPLSIISLRGTRPASHASTLPLSAANMDHLGGAAVFPGCG